MGGVALAFEVLSDLAELTIRSTAAMQQVHAMIAASPDGKTLKAEQIQQLESMQHQAVAALDAAVAEQVGGGS